MDNRIRHCWAEGRSAVLGWLHIPSAFAAESLARCGYDGLVVDLQHGAADMASVVAMLAAIEAGGCEPLVRTQANDPGDIMKLLDMGAYGIIAPLVNTVADVRRFADSLHYPPRGNRSFGPRRPFLRFGQDYLAHASDSVVSLAMIETKEGLANLDAILAEPGYDGVFIGPSDLALSLGLAPRPDSTEPVLLDAIEHIRARCHQTGKRAGLFCAEPAFARAMLAQGFDLVSVAPDLTMLTKAARQAVADVRAPD